MNNNGNHWKRSTAIWGRAFYTFEMTTVFFNILGNRESLCVGERVGRRRRRRDVKKRRKDELESTEIKSDQPEALSIKST